MLLSKGVTKNFGTLYLLSCDPLKRSPKYRHPTPLIILEMGSPFITSEQTANRKADYHGLWKLGSKMNDMALSWKLLEDLRNEKIGV